MSNSPFGGRYVLEDDGATVRKEPDLRKWARWFNEADRRVALAVVKRPGTLADLHISTVFLGLDHSFGDGPPILFETMVFREDGIEAQEEQKRYSTHVQALAGHDQIVAKCRDIMAKGGAQ